VVSLPQRKVAFYEALARLRLGEERFVPAGSNSECGDRA
jgi:hypothetical protein